MDGGILRTALVTHCGLPYLTADDQRLVAALRERHATAEPAVWDDPKVRWSEFDRVVLRSVWDYHLRPESFFAWLEARHEDGTVLWNPPRTVRWNAHKRYLLELASAGIPVVATKILPQGTPVDLAAVLRDEGWRQGVVKPAVSASAWRTFAVDIDEAGARQSDLDALLTERDALVQPRLQEVARDGEWSLVFLAGVFSHAVLKFPSPGDFRVQWEWGGHDAPTTAPPMVRQAAERAVAAVSVPWLYARVDGVVQKDQFILMELELIEPTLFLSAHPDAASRLADAILAAPTPG